MLKTSDKNPIEYLLIFIITFIAWGYVLNVPFINDDYQILGYFKELSLYNLISPFWNVDISHYYWRPLGNLLHTAILWIFGMNPLIFRLLTFLLYYLLCLQIFRFSKLIGFSNKEGLFITLLFALLPSHEYQITWIADQGEILLAILIISSFSRYLNFINGNKENLKELALSVLYFTLACLVKETAYIAIAIPLLYFLLSTEKSKEKFISVLYHSGFYLLAFLIVFLYRIIVIGGNPFTSDHFAQRNILNIIKNFFIYIPLTIVSPELLEKFAYSVYPVSTVSIAIVVLLTIVCYLIFKYFKLTFTTINKNILLFFLGWFVLFILPGIPKLMRWYAFLSSISAVFIAGIIYKSIQLKSSRNTVRFKFYFSVVVLIILIIADINISGKWVKAGKEINYTIESLRENLPELKNNNIILWASPDKLSNIPFMKLGIEQTVNWISNGKRYYSVDAPLRAEFKDFSGKVELIDKDDSSFTLKLTNGRFKPYGSPSRSVFINEKFNFIFNGYEIQIINENKDGFTFAKATIKNKNKLKEKSHLFYNGKEFEILSP